MSHKNQAQKKKKQLNNYARFSGIAFQMIAIIGIGAIAGLKLDTKYPNKYGIYSIALSFTSVIIAIVFVVSRGESLRCPFATCKSW